MSAYASGAYFDARYRFASQRTSYLDRHREL